MLTALPEWQQLAKHFTETNDVHIKSLFDQDANRFTRYSLIAAGITLDYSKNHLTDETLGLLIDLAKKANVEQQREKCLPAMRSILPSKGLFYIPH